MQAIVYSLEGKELSKIMLPEQFSEEFRPDLIRRVVLKIQSNKRQQYGAKPDAGKRASVDIPKKRRSYKTSYGQGISRSPRKVLSRQGRRFNWQGAFSPHTVKGRRAHPPKSEKIWKKKINKKENRKAILSAISSTINQKLIQRNHDLSSFKLKLPVILENKFEDLTKTKLIYATLKHLGLDAELNRAAKKKIRAGKGKARGRKYSKRKGPLIIVSQNCALLNAAKNIPGIDVTKVNELNVALLSSGINAGRLAIWSLAAIEKMEKERLFIK